MYRAEPRRTGWNTLTGLGKTLVVTGALSLIATGYGLHYLVHRQNYKPVTEEDLIKLLEPTRLENNELMTPPANIPERTPIQPAPRSIPAQPEQGLIQRIIETESSGNPRAHNRRTDARGLMQITPVVLREWNTHNPNNPYTTEDLFNGEINRQIGEWYLGTRIPEMLRANNLQDTTPNRLAAYNWGIGNLTRIGEVDDQTRSQLPAETRRYIERVTGN